MFMNPCPGVCILISLHAGYVCMYLSAADFFSILTFSNIYFRSTIRVSNSFDTDKARRDVGPGLGPNCLQRLSADDKRRHQGAEG